MQETVADSSLLRRARALLVQYEGDTLIGINYLAKKRAPLSGLATWILSRFDDWQPKEAVMGGVSLDWAARLEQEMGTLESASLLLRAGTGDAASDEEFERQFTWGAVAGFYHFSIRNTEYMRPAQSSGWLAERVATLPPVPLYGDNDAYLPTVALPASRLGDGVLHAMARRRSHRGFADDPISLADLADCLFAGLGITGFVKPFADSDECVPFKMTPSGGGRNPYEAFVYARRVGGLPRGVYHYSARYHTLGFVADGYLPSVGTVLAGQPWFDHAAALILLVAHLDRTMWKYPHPTGYRVVLLEAGHIAQNILLVATDKGLACAPTCALDDRVASRLTGCDGVTQSHVYSVALGARSAIPTAVDPIQILPNPDTPYKHHLEG